MAVKRKAEDVQDAKKITKSTAKNGDRLVKKARQDGKTVTLESSEIATNKKATKPRVAAPSLLKDEDRAFPRGGAGVLTPLEHKQIQVQATKDVLFEESGKKRAKDEEESDEEEGEREEGAQKNATKKRKKAKGKQKQVAEVAIELSIKAEGLKFKRITPGSMILGQVVKISTNELLLDLPNNLSGRVSVTNISAALTERLQDLEEEDANEDTEIKSTTGEDVNLKDSFYIGQYLRTFILSTHSESSGDDTKAKKRIELTIDPRETNRGIESSELRVHFMVQASVASIADHGFGMDMGFPDVSVTGFMSSKELPAGLQKDKIQRGAVFMCSVTGLSSNGKIVKLSANTHKTGDARKPNAIPDSPTVNSLLPGTAVEILISQVTDATVAGQVMGSLNSSVDIVHSGAATRKPDTESKYKVGDKVKARVIFQIADAAVPVLGLSILDHILSLNPRFITEHKASKFPIDLLPIGSVVENAKIINVEPGLGAFLDVGKRDVPAFVHISRISDDRVELLSANTGPYKIGSTHQARIVGYNAVDGVYLASCEKTVLEQRFLRIEEVHVGELVKATVEKLIFPTSGGCAIILKLAKGITGLVPEMHLSDIQLQHPDRKFKQGLQVNARILSVDLDRRQIRLTLKKSLVNTDVDIWTSYDQVQPGSSSLGTILTLDTKGALMQFFGNVRGFLPVSEMSDTFIDDARSHFRIGQVVTVRATSVNTSSERIGLSCRSQTAVEASNASAIASLNLGQIVNGVVLSKSEEDVTVELAGIGISATLPLAHMTDRSEQKGSSAMNQIRLGQSLRDLVIVEIYQKKGSVVVSNKPVLLKAAQSGMILSKMTDLEVNMCVDGFVRNVTSDGIFVQTIGGLTALLPRSQVSDDKSKLPDFGMTKGRSISARILSIDLNEGRFILSMKPASEAKAAEPKIGSNATTIAHNPIDTTLQAVTDFSIGKVTTAKITSVKDSQLNVQLADNVQGRIDVSEVFTNIEDIKDRKNPLRSFKAKETIPVRVLGIHDARNHRFLPISHRGGKIPVFELSAKIDSDTSVPSLQHLKTDSWHAAFVNNVTDSCVWVNLSPSVRGRIELMDLAEDVSMLADLENNFPIGSALRVRVKSVNPNSGHLDLSAKESSGDTSLTLDTLSEGMTIAGKVTRVTERSVLVQLGPTLVGQIGLTEFADDYSLANPTIYKKNDIVRVCVLKIDRANRRIFLTSRPSKVLSSSLPVKDRLIMDVAGLKVNDTIRGFVKNVADVGVFVGLSYSVTAFSRVSDLSDSYMKDWKSQFEVGRLVTAKVISIDAVTKHVQVSLKESVVSTNYVPKLSFNDLSVGQVVTGRIRKVEEFGAFVVVDNSNNVSGLCHKSEVAERRVEDVRKIYEEGDTVKAVVLQIDPEKRRISFGLKASYFESTHEDGEDEGIDGRAILDLEDGGDENKEDLDSEDGGVELIANQDMDMDNGDEDAENAEMTDSFDDADGIGAVGFNWDGKFDQDDVVSVVAAGNTSATKAKARQTRVQEDITGDLDRDGPQTTDDFERLLLSSRHSSHLWIQYMSFYVGQGQISQARKIVERALKEIPIREQDEKKQIWFAYLNLEANFGNDEAADEVFKRACEYTDAKEVHEHFASSCIRAGKLAKAEDIYQAMTKKKECSADIKFWTNYADFLLDRLSQPDRARALLKRADQSVVHSNLPSGIQTKLRRDLICKFAQLEFKSANGDAERGRNSFEDLVTTYPRQWDIWDIYVEMEKQHGSLEGVRALYERMTSLKMNKRRAAFVYKQWLGFEERNEDARKQDHVKAKAAATAELIKAAQDEGK